MRRLYVFLSCATLLVSTAAVAAPKGGGTPTVQFFPEITYLVVDSRGNRELRFASRDGASEILITKSPAAIHSHDLSSEQAKLIAYSGPGGVFIRPWQAVPLQIGAARQIFSSEVHFVDFAPDDSRLLFSTGTQLYVHDLATGTNTRLFEAGVIAEPHWSPDGSGDIFFFGGGTDQNAAWDLQKYSAASGAITRVRVAGDGFVGQLGMDVTRPSPAGTIYDEPRLVLAFDVGGQGIRMQLFGLDGTPRPSPTILGNRFRFECTNNRVVHHLELGRNDAIGMTYLNGSSAVWKKDAQIRTPHTDWLRRVPCQ